MERSHFPQNGSVGTSETQIQTRVYCQVVRQWFRDGPGEGWLGLLCARGMRGGLRACCEPSTADRSSLAVSCPARLLTLPSLCCRWSASGPMSSPLPVLWPGPSRCSPTAPVLPGAQRRRRSPWSFSWWDKTMGQWKCPHCKWVSGCSAESLGRGEGCLGRALSLLGEDGCAAVLPEEAFASRLRAPSPSGWSLFRMRVCAASVY